MLADEPAHHLDAFLIVQVEAVHAMLAEGVYLPPSGYELWTLGTAHGDAELERVLGAAATFPG